MKFSLTTLYVNDMDKSIKFYNGILGMPIIRKQLMGEGKELVFLGDDCNVNLELITSQVKMEYKGFSIGFDVENLSTVKAILIENGYAVKNEMSPNPSLTLCFIDGPNGEEVELIEYIQN